MRHYFYMCLSLLLVFMNAFDCGVAMTAGRYGWAIGHVVFALAWAAIFVAAAKCRAEADLND